jgi:hypothetical protein
MKPVPSGKATKRDYELARIARKWGADYCTRIILECRAHGVAVSDGFALVEQESDFKNIFGGDHGPTPDNRAIPPYYHHGVTQARVQALLKSPWSNGVGPGQLTDKGFVREADRDGGAHRPAVNIATSIALLGRLQKKHGRMRGFGAYNGGEGNPNMDYARRVDEKADRWHRILS